VKKNNLWRIIWIVGIYAILVVILYLMVIYKVKWEDKDLNTYLYFYDCSNNLCTSTNKVDNYYSKVICEDDICPLIKEKNENIVILKKDTKSWIYNYIDDKIISEKYSNYKLLGSDFYSANDDDGFSGVIDSNGDIIIDFKYNLIHDYKNGFIVYETNGRVGVDSELNSIEANYEDIVLINDIIFAYKKDNKYFIASYDNNDNISDTEYNYIFSVNDTIITFNNKKIDIIGTDLKSKLLMKIDSYYEYTTEKERDSLNFYKRDNFLYFSVLIDDNKKIQYIYDLKNNKLI